MHKIMKFYFPGTCMVFTLAMLSTTITNALYGDFSDYHMYMLEILGMIILFYTLDNFISKINFKTYRSYVLTGYTSMLIIYLGLGKVFGWFRFTISNIISVTIPFTLICIGIYSYFRYMGRKEADRINQLLNQ